MRLIVGVSMILLGTFLLILSAAECLLYCLH